MDRVIRDGRVAVLYSPGYGAGWSTWASDELAGRVVFDPAVVAWVESGKDGDVPVDQYGDEYLYTGGAAQLEIEWVPVGTQFRIHEYDGSEHVVLASEEEWHTA
jgi:hypothetical protein